MSMGNPALIVDALHLARAAAKDRPGRALTPIMAAVTSIAHMGSAGQFRDADQLLDRETFASGRHALTIRPLLEALGMAKARGERWIVACVERRLGWGYDFAGDDVTALEMSERVRMNFEALGDDEGVVRSLSNLGVLWTASR